MADLVKLVPQADFVALACALTPETTGLMSAAAFAAMKPSAVFVNVARGKVADEAALIETMQGNKIWAAALDVTVDEPLPAASPLWSLPNVFITPHTAGETRAYEDNVLDILMENLERLWRGEKTLRNQAGWGPSPASWESLRSICRRVWVSSTASMSSSVAPAMRMRVPASEISLRALGSVHRLSPVLSGLLTTAGVHWLCSLSCKETVPSVKARRPTRPGGSLWCQAKVGRKIRHKGDGTTEWDAGLPSRFQPGDLGKGEKKKPSKMYKRW